MLFHKGELEKALIRYQKALAIEEKCLGLGHVSVADTLFNMPIILIYLR